MPVPTPDPDAQAAESDITRHVFIDNSNISITAKTAQDGTYNPAVRVSASALTGLMERGHDGPAREGDAAVGLRVVAGSRSTNGDDAWSAHYQALGYRAEVRSRDPRTGSEVGVDAAVHAAGLQLVLDHRDAAPGSHTLVLVTGDGNGNNGLSSFPRLARAAASCGFRVEVWSWRSSMNFGEYGRVVDEFPDGRVTLHLLDAYRHHVCYLETGYVARHASRPGSDPGARSGIDDTSWRGRGLGLAAR